MGNLKILVAKVKGNPDTSFCLLDSILVMEENKSTFKENLKNDLRHNFVSTYTRNKYIRMRNLFYRQPVTSTAVFVMSYAFGHFVTGPMLVDYVYPEDRKVRNRKTAA
ncbi:hypothetical protein FRX31_021324 [Thalictrum thalictroides]|uniref:Uncharacterized protein n=1 Tax=Thalictrum thalictroides TaxID=46969 RepID=A0A7J6VVH5_THATH|nr:hypothetical protein FRX31_021324 [Thalictrum thalictroides]